MTEGLGAVVSEQDEGMEERRCAHPGCSVPSALLLEHEGQLWCNSHSPDPIMRQARQLAARPLMKVFIETIQEKSVHVVVETHAPELFGQLLVELRANNISLNDVAVYKVARRGGRSIFTLIDIEPETFDVYDLWDDGLSRELHGGHA
jgi:hypothetical protein